MFTKYKPDIRQPSAYLSGLSYLKDHPMLYAYVQQTGMYETLDLVITDELNPDYTDYYKNDQRWYLAKSSVSLKKLIHYFWFNFSMHGVDSRYVPIQLHLEDNYLIEIDTIKKMFAEDLLI